MRRSPSRPSSIRVALALALVCACVAGPARAQFTTAAPPQRQMPDVVGLTSTQAAGRLRQLGLTITTRQVASAQPQGTVVTQSPSAGTIIKQGQAAVLEVSTGQTQQDPQRGGQTDGAGTRETGSGVDVRVTPPRPGLVPDLTGMSLTMARIRLMTSGLAPGAVDSAWVEGARGGRVVAQDPRPGTQAIPGQRVRLTLAQRTPPGAQRDTPRPRDPEPQPDPRPADLVTVPDLVGLTQERARVAVGRARLLLGATDSIAAGTTVPGTVVAQKPAAGEQVPPGTFVTVTVARWQMTTVPAVVGRPRADAERILRAADLRVGATAEREDQGTAGRVLTQSIPARTTVPRGARVDLTVSRAPVVTPADTPAARTDPVIPTQRDTPRVAQQDTPAATQTTGTPADTAAQTAGTQPEVVDQEPVVTPQTGTRETPGPPPARAPRPTELPEQGGVPREVVWGALALLLLAAAYGAYRFFRRGPGRPVQAPVAVAPPPVSGAVRLRVGAGGWEAATQAAEGPMQRARLQLDVRVVDPQTLTEPAGAALGASRVAVRTVAAPVPEVRTDGAVPVGAAVQVRVRDDAPTLTVDEDTPVILSRRS